MIKKKKRNESEYQEMDMICLSKEKGYGCKTIVLRWRIRSIQINKSVENILFDTG